MAKLIKLILSDLKCYGGRTVLRSIDVFLFDARFKLVLNYRLGHFFKLKRKSVFTLFILRILLYRQITKRGCHISYTAIIGKNIKFPHPLGIVVGDNVEIGDNVSIWQHVTLGSHGKSQNEKEYPTVYNNVKIFSGAVLIGPITIGENSVIGANAVVNSDVPSGCIAVGIPSRNIVRNE